MVDHIATLTGAPQRRPLTRWQRLLVALAAATVGLLLLYALVPTLTLVLAIIAVNALVEQHKVITSRSPVDLEVITVGVAYLAAAHGIGWALLAALSGPVIAHAIMGYFGDATVVKTVSVVLVALAAGFITTVTPGALFAAMCVGYATQFVLFTVVLGRSVIINVGARLTAMALHAYLVFAVLPLLLR